MSENLMGSSNLEPENYSVKPDKRPLSVQVLDTLLHIIDQGHHNPGDRLPSEVELSRLLGVSRPTLREALVNLENRGVIERRRGVGTFVTSPIQSIHLGGFEQLESAKSVAERNNIKVEFGYRAIDRVIATDEIAASLGLEPNTPLIRFQTTIRHNINVIAYLDNYIPVALIDIKSIEHYDQGSLLDYIIDQGELPIAYTCTSIHAVEANQEQASRHELPEGSPLLLLVETYHTNEGDPVVFCRNSYPTNFKYFQLVHKVEKSHTKGGSGTEQPQLAILDRRPLYDKSIDDLNAFMEHNDYGPGDKLPPEATLAKILGISHTTLREAMSALESQGKIRRTPGIGVFITAPINCCNQEGLEILEEMSRFTQHAGGYFDRNDWAISQLKASSEIAQALEMQPDASIIQVQQTLKGKRGVCAFNTSFVSSSFIDPEELRNFKDGSLIDFVQKQGKPNLDSSLTNIYAISSDTDIAGYLKIQRGKPVLFLDQIYYSDSGKPVVIARNYLITEYLKLYITRRVVRK